MKLSLTRVIHRRVDDDPPASEELQQQGPQLARRTRMNTHVTCVINLWNRNHNNSSGTISTQFLFVAAVLSVVNWRKTYQDSGSYRCDGVSSLPPVHIALTIPAPDPVQKARHDSDGGIKKIKKRALQCVKVKTTSKTSIETLRSPWQHKQ